MNQQQLKQQLIAWRHYLHAHPESAFEEQNTSRFIAEKLEAMGIEVHRDIGKTGVVGRLNAATGRALSLFVPDIDAIQLTEQGDWSYRSMTPSGCTAADMMVIPALRWARRSCYCSGRILTARSALFFSLLRNLAMAPER
ncbi:N-acyl-L-amino acid amidohydrolase [Klebsiella pneumoniae]|uniref:N-acyl-L-amino acid amidohydrolase n=1 Tax=Klebsiella pneumoniae TaxID=573 RepID=A0A378BE65_KLEPN|nr:N-acyl-L-amino acid amidohydrolase [Klebsiella pneumoniae]